MKPGDLVKIVSVDPDLRGILIERVAADNPNWWVVLNSRGEVITWPQSELLTEETFVQEENNG